MRRIPPGIYGVSNGLFDEAWPKLTTGKLALESTVKTGFDNDTPIQILTDHTIAEDEALPGTGVPLDIERMLSSCFIRSDNYGTRACSIVKFNRRQQIEFVEHNYDHGGRMGEPVIEEIQIIK